MKLRVTLMGQMGNTYNIIIFKDEVKKNYFAENGKMRI
jgi:hypothetical protein